ncbi:unnamed protein product [Heterobilharzia americana]|nr:unnamed protein product [Heterobilharzia americana]
MAPLTIVQVDLLNTTVGPQLTQDVKSYELESLEKDMKDEPTRKDLIWSDLLTRSPNQSVNDTYPMHIQTVFRIDGIIYEYNIVYCIFS